MNRPVSEGSFARYCAASGASNTSSANATTEAPISTSADSLNTAAARVLITGFGVLTDVFNDQLAHPEGDQVVHHPGKQRDHPNHAIAIHAQQARHQDALQHTQGRRDAGGAEQVTRICDNAPKQAGS